MVQITTTQELTDHMSATMMANWSDGDGVGLQLGTSRYISSSMRGTLTCQIGPPSHAGMHLSISRHGEKTVQTGKIQVIFLLLCLLVCLMGCKGHTATLRA